MFKLRVLGVVSFLVNVNLIQASEPKKTSEEVQAINLSQAAHISVVIPADYWDDLDQTHGLVLANRWKAPLRNPYAAKYSAKTPTTHIFEEELIKATYKLVIAELKTLFG